MLPALAIIGCAGAQKSKPDPVSVEGLTIEDIKPRLSAKSVKTVYMQLNIYEIARADFTKLDNIYEELMTEPLRFMNKQSFDKNGFKAGYGNFAMLNSLLEKLEQVGAHRRANNMLIFFDARGDDITARRITEPRTVFYTDKSGAFRGSDLEFGKLVFHIKAKPSEQVRGLAEVKIVPAYKPGSDGGIINPARAETGQVIFPSMATALNMGVGDFMLIGPQAVSDELNLSNLFFTSQEMDIVYMYMFICTGVEG